MRNSTKADLSLVFVTFLWGLSFVVVKDTLSLVSPSWFLFLRFLIASLALAMLFPGFRRHLWGSTLRYSLTIGCFLYLGFAFQTLGLQLTSPAKSAFITGSAVVMVPLLNLALFKVRFDRAVGTGILLALAGLYLLTRPGDLSRVNRGDMLTFLCALAFAFHIIFIGRYATRVPYRQLAFLQVGWALILGAPAAFTVEMPRLSYPLRVYLALLFLGICCSGLAFLIQTYAQQYTSASRTALLFSLEPVFAALASITFYGEQLLASEWLGGALIVLGVIAGETDVLKSKRNRFPRPGV